MTRVDLKRGLSSRFLGGSPLSVFGDHGKIPTGCKDMDLALGGGVPIGEVFYLQGEESTGKSSLCEELSLSFSLSGGLSVIYSCQGDHPLSGFKDRLNKLGIGKRVLLISVESLRDVFQSIPSLVSASGCKVLCVIDDLASFSRPDNTGKTLKDISVLIASVKPLSPSLTLVLVNQIRCAGDTVVGAVGYRVGMQLASTAVHLGLQFPLTDPFGLEIGVYAQGRVLKFAGKSLLRWGQREFRVDTLFGRGVSDAFSCLTRDLKVGIAQKKGNHIRVEEHGDQPAVTLSVKNWMEYYEKECPSKPAW